MVTINSVKTSSISVHNTNSNHIQNNKITSIFETNADASKNKDEKGLSIGTKIAIGVALTAGTLIIADYFLCKGRNVKGIGAKLKTYINEKLLKKPICNVQQEQFGYKDVMQKLKNVYGTNDADALISKLAKESNFIGEGVSKKVYKIDGIEDYVFAVFKKADKNAVTEPFVEITSTLNKFNFGQAVAESKGKALVLGKVNGVANSIPSWIEHVIPGNISKKEAEIVLHKLEDISSYPQSSFENFASQFKYLSENGIRMDVINPNNVLIDSIKQRINLIDVLDQKERFSYLKESFNSDRDMIALLLDSILHTKYIDALPEEGKKSFISHSRTIIQKCKEAAKSVKFVGNPDITREHLVSTAKRYKGSVLIEGYDKFTNLYKDIL